MNFFEQQHRARKNTQLLVVLFLMAVAGVVLAVSGLITILFLYQKSKNMYDSLQDVSFWSTTLWVAPVTVAVIFLVSLHRILQLGGHGAKVALLLGGRPLIETNETERRLRNIVEEMSIASGVPVPDIYVLHQELGINAFAAGLEPSKAVIGITQGALDQLNRDELQGVIAHEFSHIFNGDMRLNMRLMGVLAGILFLTTAGRTILESVTRSSSSRRKNDSAAPAFFLGIGLIIIGFTGSFFARWIKAAVSRQREFLADASAVQFTRNPDGLSGALNRINNHYSNILAASAEEASHFFFGTMKPLSLFSTHPPIEERLRRIGSLHIEEAPTRFTISSKEALSHVGHPSRKDMFQAVTILGGLSDETRRNLHNSKLAMQTILGLLAKDSGKTNELSQLDPSVQKTIHETAEGNYLTLIDLSIPVLRHLEASQASHFLMTLENYIQSDGEIRPLEIATLAILRRQLWGKARQNSMTLNKVYKDALNVLKVLAQLSSSDSAQAQKAFLSGTEKMGTAQEEALAEWQKPPMKSLLIVHALTRLGALAPMDKKVFFEALWTVAHHDKQISKHESLYLRAFSAALEIPLPVALSS